MPTRPLVSLPDSIAAPPALDKLDLRWTTFPLRRGAPISRRAASWCIADRSADQRAPVAT
jgi:hypothetical protein